MYADSGSASSTDAPIVFPDRQCLSNGSALKAAVELDLFTAIGGGHDTVDTLAQRCGAGGMRRADFGGLPDHPGLHAQKEGNR